MPKHDMFNVGDIVGDRFRIEAVLGSGGFGVVFAATQLNINRKVALKVLRSHLGRDPKQHERFRREALLAQRLTHPNTVRLYDFGATENGALFIAWEYLEGVGLDEAFGAEPFDPGRVARIGSQVLKSLMEAHDHGIVHRDIKPPNIFLCEFSGERDFVKVLDFGIAKTMARDKDAPTLTEAGAIVGTPTHMAPEQVDGRPVGPTTDIYALGLVMAEALLGRPVYHEGSPMKICLQQMSDDPVPLPESVLAGPLGPIIARACQKDPAARYLDAAAMLEDIQAAFVPVSGEMVPRRSVTFAPETPAEFGRADTSDGRVHVPSMDSGPSLASPLSPVPTEPPQERAAPTLNAAPAGRGGLIAALVVALTLLVCVGFGLAGTWAYVIVDSGGVPFAEADDDEDDEGDEDDGDDSDVALTLGAYKRRSKPVSFARWKPKDLKKRVRKIGCDILTDQVYSDEAETGTLSYSLTAECGDLAAQFSLFRSEVPLAAGITQLAWSDLGVVREDRDTLVLVADAGEADEEVLEALMRRLLTFKSSK